MIKLAPSLLSANFARLEDEIKKLKGEGRTGCTLT